MNRNPNAAAAASSGAIVRGRRPPQCPSTAQQPTPILKSSSTALLSKRKRRPPGNTKRPSALQFSQDVVILERSMEEEAEAEEEEEEESDTDVGSHGDFDEEEEGDFSFDGGEEEEVDFGAGGGGLFGNVDAGAKGGSSPVTRAAAKVRRLTLGGADDDDDGGGEAAMDVKTSLARASVGRDSGGRSSLGSPPRKSHGGAQEQPRGMKLFGGGGFGSPPSSPPRENAHPRRNDGNMPLCPPSTAKKSGGVSRLFTGPSRENDSPNFGRMNTNADVMEEEEEEDVSPRDVVDFPFFAASPSSNKKSGKVDFQQNLRTVDSMMNPASPLPQCPPSTMKKKPNRRTMDLNHTDRTMGSRDPPKGLKAVGRAHSFLQMFSQEVPVDALRQIHEGDGGDDDDEGGDGGFLSKPTRQNSEWSVDGEQQMTTCPSPRRPVRGHRRFTPASPPKAEGTQATSPFSRFAADFEVVGTLGNGAYGHVYKVRHRTDKRMYAIKAARREARGASDRDRMLQEVYALAALSDQACTESMHIVRYFQAWMEENRLYIQTELCDGTLREEMARGVLRDEKRRYKLLREMLLALDLVHKSGSIHLDIKPDNVFVKNDRYKLGDFGLVSKIEDRKDVEEGDSRYMSMELLQGDLDDLTKSDIFSLGATMYEICLDRDAPLPENGPEWQDMRRGQLLPMPRTTFDLTMIVREMMAPDPQSRPSAEELLKKRQLLSDEQKQLIAERNKAEAANKALDAQKQRMIKLLSPKANPRKFARSNTFC